MVIVYTNGYLVVVFAVHSYWDMPHRDAAEMEVCAGLRDSVSRWTFYDNDAIDEMIRIDRVCHMFTSLFISA